MFFILCILLAAIFKAIADTVQHHYHTSVFSEFPMSFWNPAISWKYVGFIKFTKYRPDAWHLANSLMIVAFVLAACVNDLHCAWYHKLWIGGVAFISTFNLFYNRVLILEKFRKN